MELTTTRDAARRAATQEISNILRNPMFHCSIQKSPLLDYPEPEQSSSYYPFISPKDPTYHYPPTNLINNLIINKTDVT
jgi:hypothetical protein